VSGFAGARLQLIDLINGFLNGQILNSGQTGTLFFVFFKAPPISSRKSKSLLEPGLAFTVGSGSLSMF
jgi:hypothetical protein